MKRATIDVYVFVSALLGPRGISRQIILALAAGLFVPVISPHILFQVQSKLHDPDILRRFRITDADRAWIVGVIATYADSVTVTDDDIVVVTGDPEDDAVLATARVGEADYLVTGDKGLLGLRAYDGIRILSPRDFLTELGASKSMR